MDIALAQIAALGATVACLLGYDPRSEGAYWFSLGFAVLAAAVFALTRTRHERVPQEAVIGLTYAVAPAWRERPRRSARGAAECEFSASRRI